MSEKPATKTCSVCGKAKPAKEFPPQRSKCKACLAAYMAAYRRGDQSHVADEPQGGRPKRTVQIDLAALEAEVAKIPRLDFDFRQREHLDNYLRWGLSDTAYTFAFLKAVNQARINAALADGSAKDIKDTEEALRSVAVASSQHQAKLMDKLNLLEDFRKRAEEAGKTVRVTVAAEPPADVIVPVRSYDGSHGSADDGE